MSVAYDPDGEIRATDADALNLNHATLKRNRSQVIDVVRKLAGDADATELRRMLTAWRGTVDHRRKQYAGVAIYFLERRLKAVEAKGRRTRKAPRRSAT